MDQNTAAYIAGIIDGEGYLYFNDPGRGRGRPRPQLEVSSIDPELILWLHEAAGGYRPAVIARGGNRKPEHRWRINGNKCKALIEQCLPFLRIERKREVAARILLW